MVWQGHNRNTFRDALSAELVAGFVVEQQHPTLPLSLFCYTARCQWERAWTDRTKVCRGIIFDDERCVAKPFDKFLNDGEHAEGEIPWGLGCRVYDKLDGSMITAFHYAGEWRCATKGSFDSAQAAMALPLLQSLPTERFAEDHTLVFELIHPENRIVCDYGDRCELVLLAVFDRRTGLETPPWLLTMFDGVNVVRSEWCGNPCSQRLRGLIQDHEEGYVLRFENGFRCKIKGERYLYLHRLINSLTPRRILDELIANGSLDSLGIPEEHRTFADSIANGFRAEFKRFDNAACDAFNRVHLLATRKDQAAALASCDPIVRTVVFTMLDGKEATPAIWKAVKRSLKNDCYESPLKDAA